MKKRALDIDAEIFYRVIEEPTDAFSNNKSIKCQLRIDEVIALWALKTYGNTDAENCVNAKSYTEGVTRGIFQNNDGASILVFNREASELNNSLSWINQMFENADFEWIDDMSVKYMYSQISSNGVYYLHTSRDKGRSSSLCDTDFIVCKNFREYNSSHPDDFRMENKCSALCAHIRYKISNLSDENYTLLMGKMTDLLVRFMNNKIGLENSPVRLTFSNTHTKTE